MNTSSGSRAAAYDSYAAYGTAANVDPARAYDMNCVLSSVGGGFSYNSAGHTPVGEYVDRRTEKMQRRWESVLNKKNTNIENKQK